uniref:Prolyl 4-hydroxylase alpha-subunit N-terminal domain-containing protein n=1 Tax=Clastoptera arizonana TaxID=38151 RepID=A0A1B6CI12_9HEMI
MYIQLFILITTCCVFAKKPPPIIFGDKVLKEINILSEKALKVYRETLLVLKRSKDINEKIVQFRKLIEEEKKVLVRVKEMWDKEGYNKWNSYEPLVRALGYVEELKNSTVTEDDYRLAEMERVYKEMGQIRECLALEGIIWYTPLYERKDNYEWDSMSFEIKG